MRKIFSFTPEIFATAIILPYTVYIFKETWVINQKIKLQKVSENNEESIISLENIENWENSSYYKKILSLPNINYQNFK